MFPAETQFVALLTKPLLIGFVAGVAFALGRRRLGDARGMTLADILMPIPIVLVAYIAGYLTGISGSPAIGNLVPATLAFIGGLNVYLFGVDIAFRAISLLGVFLFAVVLLYGVLDGAYKRVDEHETQMQILAEQELRIRNYRQNLNLPPDPPAWANSGQ